MNVKDFMEEFVCDYEYCNIRIYDCGRGIVMYEGEYSKLPPAFQIYPVRNIDGVYERVEMEFLQINVDVL